VWNLNPRLRIPKVVGEGQVSSILPVEPSTRSLSSEIQQSGQQYVRDIQNYFSSSIWIPSLALAFLHLSALSYSATFVTYLLSVGFSLDLITVARAAGSMVEISSTFVTPVGIKYLGKAASHGSYHSSQEDEPMVDVSEGDPEEEAKIETGLARLGLWGIAFQLINLVSFLL
jgi:iron-regulated transporter 1